MHGTAGTEQLGSLVRQTIGGALDAVGDHGGDAIAFGGDAIAATFESGGAWSDARHAAEDIVRLVAAARARRPSPALSSSRCGSGSAAAR